MWDAVCLAVVADLKLLSRGASKQDYVTFNHS